MDRPSCSARVSHDRACMNAHQLPQLPHPGQTASSLPAHGLGASRQHRRRDTVLRLAAVQTAERLQTTGLSSDVIMLNQHRREGDYEAGLVQLQVLSCPGLLHMMSPHSAFGLLTRVALMKELESSPNCLCELRPVRGPAMICLSTGGLACEQYMLTHRPARRTMSSHEWRRC